MKSNNRWDPDSEKIYKIIFKILYLTILYNLRRSMLRSYPASSKHPIPVHIMDQYARTAPEKFRLL